MFRGNIVLNGSTYIDFMYRRRIHKASKTLKNGISFNKITQKKSKNCHGEHAGHTQNMYVMIKQMFDYVFIRYSTRA